METESKIKHKIQTRSGESFERTVICGDGLQVFLCFNSTSLENDDIQDENSIVKTTHQFIIFWCHPFAFISDASTICTISKFG